MISTLDKVALEGAGSLALKTGFDLGWAPGTATYLTGKGVEGWTGSAPIRRNKSELLGAHGTHAERGYKDERLITVTLHHVAVSRAAAGLYADELAAFLGDGTEGVFRVDDASLGTRWAEVYLAAGGVDAVWTGGVDVAAQIFMVAPDSRKYGALVTSAAAGVPVPGSGLVFPLFSRSLVSSSVTRTNGATNPSGEVDLSQWNFWPGSSGAASMTRPVTGGYAGSAFARLTWTTSQGNGGHRGGFYPQFPVAVGETGSARLAVRPNKALPMVLSLEWIDVAGSNIIREDVGSLVSVPANTWTELFINNKTAPAGTGSVRVTAYAHSTAGPWLAGDTLDADALLWDRGAAVAGTPFDGSTPPVQVDADTTRTYSWTGAPHASTSIETTKEYSGANGVLDIGAGGYLGRASVTNTGTADTGPVFTIWGDYVPGFALVDVATGRRLVYTETLTAGQTLVLDANDGSVTLDGYAPRDSKLVVSDWTRLGRGETGTWQLEAPGSTNAQFTVGVSPAWW